MRSLAGYLLAALRFCCFGSDLVRTVERVHIYISLMSEQARPDQMRLFAGQKSLLVGNVWLNLALCFGKQYDMTIADR